MSEPLTVEERAIILRALHQLAQSEAARYAEPAGNIPYASWWRSKQEEAKRIGKLAIEVELGVKL